MYVQLRMTLDVVTICRSYGVNVVYVSGIKCRPGYDREVKEVNHILYQKSYLHDFKFITNNNITSSHIFRDKIHLNDDGSKVLASNFIRAINNNIKHS